MLPRAIKTLEDAYSYNADIALINYRLAAYNLLKHNISEGLMFFKRGMKNNLMNMKKFSGFIRQH